VVVHRTGPVATFVVDPVPPEPTTGAIDNPTTARRSPDETLREDARRLLVDLDGSSDRDRDE
jgi:hypothetical protein